MSQGINIPIKIEADTRAADAVVASLGRVEQELLAVARASEAGSTHQRELAAQFTRGELSAAQLAEALRKVATDVAASRDRWREHSAALHENIASGESTLGSLRTLADGFNEITSAASTAIGVVERVATVVAELADEQRRLSIAQAQLGLNFDAAAEAGGRYVSSLTVMTAAQRMAQAGISVTQDQLDQIVRRAGVFATATGEDMAGAVETLSQALIAGEEEGLRRFGGSLGTLAGQSHTAQERIAALAAETRTMTTAARTMGDELQSAGGKVRGFGREFVDAFRDSNDAISRLNRDLQGSTSQIGDMRSVARDLGHAFAVGFTVARVAAGGILDLLRSTVGMIADISRSLAGVGLGLSTPAEMLRAMDEAAERIADRMRAHGEREVNRQLQLQNILSGDVRGAAADIAGERGDAARGATSALARPANDNATGWATTRADELGAAQAAALRGTTAPTARRGGGGSQRADSSWRDEIASMTSGVEERARIEREAAAESTATTDELASARDELRALSGRSLDEVQQYVTEAAALEESLAQRELNTLKSRGEHHRRFTEELAALYTRQTSMAATAADLTQTAFKSVGDALVSHVVAFATGREELGDALKGMLHDTLESIGKEASVKAALNVAEGLGALATYRFDAAANHFAAAGVYTGVAVAAGLGAGALAPAAQQAGQSGGASRERSSSDRLLSERASPDAATAQNIVVNYWAPVVGGRQMLDADVGVRLDRYNEAASARQRRAA